MLQDESDMRGRIQIWDDLNVALQAVIGQLLEFRRQKSIRFDKRRRTFVLEMALEFDGESVDLVECRLTHGLFQDGQGFDVMSVVPVDDAHLEIRPIRNLTLG